MILISGFVNRWAIAGMVRGEVLLCFAGGEESQLHFHGHTAGGISADR